MWEMYLSACSLARLLFLSLWISCGSDAALRDVYLERALEVHTCVSYTLHTNRPQPRGRFVEPPDPDDHFHGCSWPLTKSDKMSCMEIERLL